MADAAQADQVALVAAGSSPRGQDLQREGGPIQAARAHPEHHLQPWHQGPPLGNGQLHVSKSPRPVDGIALRENPYFSVQISSIVGFEVRPNENSTLLDMLMAGLSEFSDRLVQHGGKYTSISLLHSVILVYLLMAYYHR